MLSSPLRLDLYIDCSDSSPVRELLDIWPPFPIQVTSFHLGDNIIAALEHRDRISKICLSLRSLRYEKLAAVIQEPLPALTSLELAWEVGPGDESMPALPATFLGGSAPRLESLTLKGVPFPTLPQLLLSCNDLSELTLHDISYLGYISPEAMVTGLSALTKLTCLYIGFGAAFLPDQIIQHPPLLTRTTAVLPTLKEFLFEGFSEYLEDLLAQIDLPQLEVISVMFLRQHVSDIRQVISHSRTIGSFNRARILFDHFSVVIQLHQPDGTDPIKFVELGIQEDEAWPAWQVSSITQIGTQLSYLLSSITELDIHSDPDCEVLMDNTEWLELFHLFSAVQTLRLSGDIQSHVISSLQELTGESIAEALPKLLNLYFRKGSRSEFVQHPIGLFFAPSDHPVTPRSA